MMNEEKDITVLSKNTIEKINVIVILSIIIGACMIFYAVSLSNIFLFGVLFFTFLMIYMLEQLGKYIIKDKT